MTEEDLRARIKRIIAANRPALDRMAHGPYPLEQQCPHLLMRQPVKDAAFRYICKNCDGLYVQPWEPHFAGLSVFAVDSYVEGMTGGQVIGTRVRPLLAGELDPLEEQDGPAD